MSFHYRLWKHDATRIGTIVPGTIVLARVPWHDMDLTETLAANLRRLRQTTNLTQEDLADLSGLSARYIGAIERANVSPTVKILGRLANALQVDPCDLIRSRNGSG